MEEGSAFIYSEILAAGRVRAVKFSGSGISQRDKDLLRRGTDFLENQFLFPKVQNLEGIGFFEGFTHQASMVFFVSR